MRAGPNDAGSGSETTAGTLQFVIAIQNPKVPPNPQLHLFTSLIFMLGTGTLGQHLWHRGSAASTGSGIVLPSYDLQVTVAQKEPKTAKEESRMERELRCGEEVCPCVFSLATTRGLKILVAMSVNKTCP